MSTFVRFRVVFCLFLLLVILQGQKAKFESYSILEPLGCPILGVMF